jgi:hypothetical protein
VVFDTPMKTRSRRAGTARASIEGSFLALAWAVAAATGCGSGGGAAPPPPGEEPDPRPSDPRGPAGTRDAGKPADPAPAAPDAATAAAGPDAGAPRADSGGPPTTVMDGPPSSTPSAPAALAFDPPGGTFAGTQVVKLAAGTTGAAVHFTVDGSLPTRTSPAYREPLSLTATTVIRAFVEGAAGAPDAPVVATVFVKVADDAAAFTSNLPIVLLHTHASGVLSTLEHAEYVSGSAMVFDPPAGGRAKLLGAATTVARAGLRIRGSSSVMFPQKSYGIELRAGGSDDDEDHVVAGLPAEADWALVAPSRTDRALIRNTLFFALSNEVGRYAPRVRAAEVFVVESGGAVAKADYKGVFQLCEKVERGKDRVDVEKLAPTALAEPALSGGYVFRIDHISKSHPPHFYIGPYPFEFKYPEWDDLNVPARQPQRAYLQGYLQEFFDAIARPDFKNPKTGKPYGEYIDVPSFIDYNLLVALSKNVDGLKYSAYFHKDRGGLVKAGPLWDFDRTAGTKWDDDYGRRTEEPREWARLDATNPLTWGFWPRLFADPAFKAAYSKRWKELALTTFSTAHVHELIDRLAGEVGEAQARHFARWTELPPSGGSHAAEIKILKDWMAARIAWLSTQL